VSAECQETSLPLDGDDEDRQVPGSAAVTQSPLTGPVFAAILIGIYIEQYIFFQLCEIFNNTNIQPVY
jgi:hypothetical protein